MQSLTGWILILLIVAGHTEWWVTFVNRTHALPIRARSLRKLRAAHDVAVTGFPILLLWLLYDRSSDLDPRTFLQNTGTGIRALMIFSTAGCLPLAIAILRWNLLRRRQFHSKDSVVHCNVIRSAESSMEVTEVLGPRRHVLCRVPGNEVWKLDITTKSVHLRSNRRLTDSAADQSVERRPLRVVHFSDVHFIGCPGDAYYRFAVQQICESEPDLILFTGDLIDRMALLPNAVEILRPLTRVAPCCFVLGNHDWKYDHELIRQSLVLSGWRCMTGIAELLMVDNRRVLLGGSERPWMGHAPPPAGDTDCDVRILLSHTPDQFRFAKQCGYQLMVSGHTHGGQVVLPIIGPVYAPSIYGVSYAAGLFVMDELVLHVSRGMGAKDPLRWRCPPECTILKVYC